MTTNSRLIYATAKAHEGTWEWKAGANPKIMQWFKDSGHGEIKDDSTPWCAAFANGVLAELGIQGTGSLLARSFSEWGEHVDPADAQPGDIVVISRGTKSWQGHVGFFSSMNSMDIYLLGGNQRDQVNVSRYSRSRLVAIRRFKVPRESVTQSTTLRGVGTAAAGIGTAAVPALGALDGTAQVVLIAGVVVALLALLWIARERIKKWAQGIR